MLKEQNPEAVPPLLLENASIKSVEPFVHAFADTVAGKYLPPLPIGKLLKVTALVLYPRERGPFT